MSNTVFKKLNIDLKMNSGVCIGGKWLSSNNVFIIQNHNPATQQHLPTVLTANVTQCQKTIDAAHNAFLTWRTWPAPKRGEIIKQLGDAFRAQKELLATLISVEMGKIYQEALGEVQEMIDMADFAVGQSRMLYGLTIQSERPSHTLLEKWHPLGVVGVITAFNFPMAVWAWNAFLSIIAGDAVVWKPSSKTPLCAIAIQHICNQVMKKNKTPGIFSLLAFHDKTVSDVFIDHPKLALIAFTGSTKTGRTISERVSKRLGKCLLEMGGNNAVIVDASADLSLASHAILFGAVGTAGQRCTTTRRLFLHEKIYDNMLQQLVAAYKQIKIGNPLNNKILMGPLISAQAVDAFTAAIKTVKSCGGKIVAGGKVLKQKSNFVEPTIVTAENHWDIVQTETFVPILYVMQYRDLSDAICMHNESKYGLSSSLFTNDLKQAEYFLSAMGSDCGIANINAGTTGSEIGGAFGGEKCTGGGREAGSDAWKSYMRRQTNTINWSSELPLAQGIEFTEPRA